VVHGYLFGDPSCELPIYRCPRHRMGFKTGEGIEVCPATHAEVNAVLTSRMDVRGSTIYCSFHEIPCRECSKVLINAGIKLIVLNGGPIDYPQPGIHGRELLNMVHVEVKNGRKK
jgi:deoxycytidylate deaminase